MTEMSINQTLKILLMPVAQLEKKSLLFKEKKTSTTVAQKDKRLIGTDLLPNAVRPQRIKSSPTTEVDKQKPLMPVLILKASKKKSRTILVFWETVILNIPLYLIFT